MQARVYDKYSKLTIKTFRDKVSERKGEEYMGRPKNESDVYIRKRETRERERERESKLEHCNSSNVSFMQNTC
jgi:hypothetical protein